MSRLRRAALPLLFATLLVPSVLPPIAMAETQQQTPRTIAISGSGEVTAAPDMASVTVGVVEQADTAGAALAANNTKMGALLTALKDAGIADKDVQTSNFSVNPRYEFDQQKQTQKMIGYEVSNQVTVRVRKLDQLGALLDTLVKAGSNQMYGISFSIADTAKLEDEARKRAYADAKHKADVYAAAAGVKVGKVLSLSESSGYRPPMPVFARKMAADAAPAVPVAAGEASVSASVDVVWEVQ